MGTSVTVQHEEADTANRVLLDSRATPGVVVGESPLTVGLDIGGTKVLGVVLDGTGQVCATVRMPTRLGPQGVVDAAHAAVSDLLGQVGRAVSELAGVGIGLPGLVDPISGQVMHAVNLGIDGVPLALADLLAARLGVPVVVDNDLNVAALGASHEMGGQGGDIAFLSLGTGVAAGIVLEGRLRRGVSGAAGEVGHIPIVVDGPVCACGQRGCVELYASGPGIEARWPARYGRPAPAELFEAAQRGDPHALRIRQETVGAIAAAVRILGLTVDVRYVVLGGGVCGIGMPLLTAVREALVDQARGSAFLTSLDLASRVILAPSRTPVAAVGAALVGRGKVTEWKL
jgi:predicted NBD/HSP70 family sugar kinase